MPERSRKRVLDAVLVFSFDKRTARDIKRGVVSIEDAMERLDNEVQRVDESLDRLANGFRIVEIAGDELSNLGGQILRPMQDAARMYVEQAGRADAVSRRWLNATEDLEKTQFRVGRAVATAILPLLEDAARLAETAAEFAERNPQIIRAALNIGMVVASLGAVGMAVTKGIRLYTDLKSAAMAAKQFIAAKMMQSAANKQLAAAAGMRTGAGAGAVSTGARAVGIGAAAKTAGIFAAVVAGGAILGGQLADKVFGPLLMGAEEWEKYMGGLKPMQKVGQIVGQTVAVIGYAFSGLGEKILRGLGLDKLADKYRASVDTIILRINGLTTVSNRASTGLSAVSASIGQALDAFIDYKRDEAESTRQYERDRALTIKQFGQEMVRMETEYQFQRARVIRDFERDMAREVVDFQHERGKTLERFDGELRLDEEEYYRQRQLRAEEHGRDMAQMERDHQLQLRRDLEDHNLRLRDAVAARDFDAYMQEREEHELERRRSEEDHNKEVALMSKEFARERALEEEEYARQLALRHKEFQIELDDEQEQFDRMREQALKDHELSLADMAEEQERERAYSKKEHQRDLALMQDQFDEEGRIRDASFADQIRELDASLLGERETRDKYYALMAGDLEKWLSGMHSSMMAGYPSSASSSWSSSPPYLGRRQGGGYIREHGLVEGGEGGREYVLSHASTRRMEGMFGGPLRQDMFGGRLAAAGGTASSMTINLTGNIGGVGPGMNQELLNQLVPVVAGVVEDRLEEFVVEVRARSSRR